ncbi:MAG: DUF917 domain-containing protein [Thermoplasmata archaeon]
MRNLTKEDVDNLLYGATFLGTGGGGSMEMGLELLNKDLNDGLAFQIADLDELDDHATIASPYYVGAVGNKIKINHSKDPALLATNVLENYVNKKVDGIIAAELGGYATAGALHVAASKNIPLLDADAAGRAAPDLQCSLFYIADIPITPFSVYTLMDDEIVVKSISSNEQAELIVRKISTLSSSSVGLCDHLTTASTLKNSCAKNTISKAIEIGKNLRKRSLESLLKINEIYELFKGKLSDSKWEIRNGFTYGYYTLDGIGEYSGSKLKIWFKNENLISWLNDSPYITSPDLIILTTVDLNPVTNPINKTGQEYFVFGMRSDKKWRTVAGLNVMAPKFFGFEIEYKPIENILEPIGTIVDHKSRIFL